MSAQTLIANGLVLAAALYALWALMPSAWRRPLAQHMARRLGLPAPAQDAGGCGSGCGGCTAAPSSGPAGQPRQAVITVHRRIPPRP